MIRAAALLAFSAIPAAASETCSGRFSFSSTAILRETNQPGATAEVLFRNTSGDGTEDIACMLQLDGLFVGVDMVLGRGADPDTATITPPSGYIAVPETTTIKDGSADTILIFPEDNLVAF